MRCLSWLIPATERPTTTATLQANFSTIYAEDDVTNDVVVSRIASVLQQS